MTSRWVTAAIITLVLAIIPLPSIVSGMRPPFTLLLILYTQCYIPKYFNLFFIFILGLCLDVLLSTFMGVHAFAILIVCWMMSRISRRFQFFMIGQQMLFICLFCFTYQLVLILENVLMGLDFSWFNSILSAITGMLFWPWLKILADDLLFFKHKTPEVNHN